MNPNIVFFTLALRLVPFFRNQHSVFPKFDLILNDNCEVPLKQYYVFG